MRARLRVRRVQPFKAFNDRAFRALLAAGAGCAIAIACSGGADRASRERLLLISVDTLRPDYLSANGYDLPTTPFLDAVLADAVVFRRAIAPVPRTTQALASLMTGQYPQVHGARTLFGRVSQEVVNLAELAKQAGYSTLAVVSNHILVPERGLARGFDVYDHASDARNAEGTTRAALARLSERSGEAKLFVWVHYIDPHVPYYPPRELAEQFDPDYVGRYPHHFGAEPGGVGNRAYPEDLPKARAVYNNPLPEEVNAHVRRLYAADVRQTDDAIRELVEGLRRQGGPGWTIVFTADHGESLGEHDYYWDHGDYAYNASLRVPLAFAFPEGDPLRRSRQVDAWVSLVDVMPTLVALLGLPVPDATFAGHSLVPYLEGRSVSPWPVFAESGKSFFPHLLARTRDPGQRQRAVIDADWKLIWTPGRSGSDYELYDLASDPNESRDLFAPDHPEVRRLASLLEGWHQPGEADEAPSAADVERLRSLGYLE